MRALRYLDDAALWNQNLRTDEVAKSENREVLRFLQAQIEQQLPLTSDAVDQVPQPIAQHVRQLLALAAREPEIPAPLRAAEFDRLILKVREQSAMRKQAERATLLAQRPETRPRDVDPAVLDDLAALHTTKSELTRLTLLAQP